MYHLVITNSSPWKIPYKQRFLDGKIIYKWAIFHGWCISYWMWIAQLGNTKNWSAMNDNECIWTNYQILVFHGFDWCFVSRPIARPRCRTMVVCPPLNLGDRRKIKALRDGLKLLLAARRMPWLCHGYAMGTARFGRCTGILRNVSRKKGGKKDTYGIYNTDGLIYRSILRKMQFLFDAFGCCNVDMACKKLVESVQWETQSM